MTDETKKKAGAAFGLIAVLVVGYQAYNMTRAPSGATTWKTKSGGTTATSTPRTPAGGTAVASAGGAIDPLTFQEDVVDIDALLKDIEVVNFDYQTEHEPRDPMSPLVGLIRPQTGMEAQAPMTRTDVMNRKVTGIIQDPVSPAAVVDDEVVTQGYVYPDGTVVYAIERDRVVFRIGDSLVPVEMKKLGMR